MDVDRTRLEVTARIGLVVVAASLGALFAFGSIVAAMLEADGFTSASRDGARIGYLVLLGLGLLASIVVPALIALWAFPEQRSAVLSVGSVGLLLGFIGFGAVLR